MGEGGDWVQGDFDKISRFVQQREGAVHRGTPCLPAGNLIVLHTLCDQKRAGEISKGNKTLDPETHYL